MSEASKPLTRTTRSGSSPLFWVGPAHSSWLLRPTSPAFGEAVVAGTTQLFYSLWDSSQQFFRSPHLSLWILPHSPSRAHGFDFRSLRGSCCAESARETDRCPLHPRSAARDPGTCERAVSIPPHCQLELTLSRCPPTAKRTTRRISAAMLSVRLSGACVHTRSMVQPHDDVSCLFIAIYLLSRKKSITFSHARGSISL